MWISAYTLGYHMWVIFWIAFLEVYLTPDCSSSRAEQDLGTSRIQYVYQLNQYGNPRRNYVKMNS